MNHRSEAGGTQDTTPMPTVDVVSRVPKINKKMKIDHNKVSRVWREGGPKIQNVKIKTLYEPSTSLVVLQFEDELGPVFRASFKRDDLRKLIDDINDALLEIDLDEAEAARKVDEQKTC